jgi:peptide/nickel transport system substrate-binding protein
MRSRALLSITLALVVLAVVAVPAAQTPRRGGVLNAMLIENPPGFSIHEAATIAGVWPVAPCFSNLVIFDPLKPVDTAETVIPELAEKWS